MERRTLERVPTSVPVEVFVGAKKWNGTCINLSAEGALLKLDALWEGDQELALLVDAREGAVNLPTPAHVVRATSPDQQGTFLAVRFLNLIQS